MSVSSAVGARPFHPIQAARSGLDGLLSLEDDQAFARVHSVAIQAALSIVLSLLGLGSAMAQSIDHGLAFGANTQATRDRVIQEISQARADGRIKRWSPVLVEVPIKATLTGSRSAPFAAHQVQGGGNRFVPRDEGAPSPDIAAVFVQSAQ